MTRKHFELIAKIIAKCGGAPESEKYNINALLREQNGNFDSDRFWNAVEKELDKDLSKAKRFEDVEYDEGGHVIRFDF